MCAQASTHHWRNNTSSLSPTSLTFASQSVGTASAAQTVTLANNSSAAISISSVAVSGNFSQSNNCGTSLAADARCTISVTFKPTASGTSTGSLSVTDSARSSAQTISLTGTVTGAASSAAPTTSPAATTTDTFSPASLTFASQTVNTSSASQTVTFTNTGSTTITVSSIAVSANFSQSNNCGSSLSAGAQCSIVVLFDPTQAGSVSGSVAITDSASTAPQTVALTGTATASATHSVSLSWTPSTSSNVVGYNVYRSTTSGGYYSELNSAALTGTSYSDTTVTAGTTYYYVATAINSSGEQSSYSSQATAVVP